MNGWDQDEWPSEALGALARACGVATEYHRIDGSLVRCSRSAVLAALGAMGIDGSSDAACANAMAELDEYVWTRMVPPSTVTREGRDRDLMVHVPAGLPVSAAIQLEEGGTVPLAQVGPASAPRTVAGVELVRAFFTIPADLPLGWHIAEVSVQGRRARGYVVVTPEALELSPAVAFSRPWGFMAQLYSIRSSRSWGVGDFGDLAELCSLAKIRAGADFMLINPVHANEVVPPLSPSPYLPSSRRFLAPMYIRVEDIPEVAYVPSQARAVLEWESERPRRANVTADEIDRDGAWAAKLAALEQVFMAPRTDGREAQFEAFCIREGKALEDYATWASIAEAFADPEAGPWPAELADPSSSAVTAWKDSHADRVLFHAWLQWVADEQAAKAQAAAIAAGMEIGVMADLAVGVHPSGADAWGLGRVLASSMSVGAPPDAFNPLGQDWSQPPWQPRALEAAAYVPFRDVVRSAVRHAGAIRIDHILGMFRQWWIPRGNPASDGTYVQFDFESLVGIIALEAHKAGAIVIGEDLGTVEPWVRDYLASRGVLGTSVLWFERTEGGGFQPPEHYRPNVLATVTTHDLPPTALMLNGGHVDLRASLGLVQGSFDEAKAWAHEENQRLIATARERGWLIEDFNEEDLLAALHTWVLRSPAALTGVALTDAVGDMRAQNVPGTFREYPNWMMPLTDRNGVPVLLDDLFDHPRLLRLVDAVNRARLG